jgi:hypothetical protein
MNFKLIWAAHKFAIWFKKNFLNDNWYKIPSKYEL